MWARNTCGGPTEIELTATNPSRWMARPILQVRRDGAARGDGGAGTRLKPFNSTPMAVNPISSGSPHVRPTGVHRTCGEPDEIKKNTHPKNIPALFFFSCVWQDLVDACLQRCCANSSRCIGITLQRSSKGTGSPAGSCTLGQQDEL